MTFNIESILIFQHNYLFLCYIDVIDEHNVPCIICFDLRDVENQFKIKLWYHINQIKCVNDDNKSPFLVLKKEKCLNVTFICIEKEEEKPKT